MRPFKWVSANDLDHWAESTEARFLLPRLIRLLVHGTVERADLEHVNFPADEQNHRPGYDGETKTRRGNAKVPEGIAYWEMGADVNVKTKLDNDYKKRICNRGPGDFSKVSYVAITPRDYQNKKDWATEKNLLGNWREVRVYDSDDLEQWLEMAPAVARQFASAISNKSPSGLCDLSTRWENIRGSLKLPLPAEAVLVGRDAAIKQIGEWVNGSPRCLAIAGHSPQEAVDAFTAWVSSLPEAEQSPIASRGIIVDDAALWTELAESKHGLILVCGNSLEVNEQMVSVAAQNGHHVLLSMSTIGTKASGSLRLERLDRFKLAEILRTAGAAEQEAFSLAQQSGGSFTVLKRRFSSVPLISKPLWGRGRESAELAPLLLAGAWSDANVVDQKSVCEIAGSPYADVRKVIARWRPEPNSPVRWSNGVWEFVSPLDAWSFLHPSLNADQLDAFERSVSNVLGVDDPRLDLPTEDRWLANIKGKELENSSALRQGLARTLALLATRSSEDELTDTVSLQGRVNRAVRTILPESAGWKRWASLGNLLPLLAESAPDVFLRSVESGLQGYEPELPKLFREEAGPVTGRAEHTGLLWALERLAWSPEFLPRTALVLAKLAEFDPGGKWANRPKASLREIFFSWMPHTAAPLDERLDLLKMISDRHPEVGWRLLLDLLPEEGEMVMQRHPPEWRFWAEGWKRGVTNQELSRTVTAVVELLISQAHLSSARWIDLLPHIPSFPVALSARAIQGLKQFAESELAPETAKELWTKLGEFIQRHRFNSGAHWAIDRESLARLEAVRDRVRPTDAVALALPVFKNEFDLVGDKSLSWQQQDELRSRLRIEAVMAILQERGFEGILELAGCVERGSMVGQALFEATGEEHSDSILPGLLDSGDGSKAALAAAFARCRIFSKNGREWAENLLLGRWPLTQAAALITQMPFDPRTWKLATTLGKSVETAYWSETPAYWHGLSTDEVERASRKLLDVGRPRSALSLLAREAEKGGVAPIVQLELLEMSLASLPKEKGKPLDLHSIQTLLGQLQLAKNIDETRLGRIEWLLLPMLQNGPVQPITLFRLLSRQPSFFIELLTLAYRSRHEQVEVANTGEPEELRRIQAKHAWQLLHEWRSVPGTTSDGEVSASALNAWVGEARKLARACGRLEASDVTLGEVLAHDLGEEDGSWPSVPVREVLEAVDCTELLHGFTIGIANKRGGYTKSLTEGGKQERELAAKYRRHAEGCRVRWPKTSSALMQVAKDYLRMAEQADAEVEARE